MSLVLGFVKVLSFADMLMNTPPQHTTIIVVTHKAVEPNSRPYLPKDFRDFLRYLNICNPGSYLIF